jgi:hypothetical protein
VTSGGSRQFARKDIFCSLFGGGGGNKKEKVSVYCSYDTNNAVKFCSKKAENRTDVPGCQVNILEFVPAPVAILASVRNVNAV